MYIYITYTSIPALVYYRICTKIELQKDDIKKETNRGSSFLLHHYWHYSAYSWASLETTSPKEKAKAPLRDIQAVWHVCPAHISTSPLTTVPTHQMLQYKLTVVSSLNKKLNFNLCSWNKINVPASLQLFFPLPWNVLITLFHQVSVQVPLSKIDYSHQSVLISILIFLSLYSNYMCAFLS